MDRQQYIDEAMRQLTNRTNYETLDSDPTGNFCKEIQETLDDMRDNNYLSKKAHKFLSPTDCRTARFYLLPKVHKLGNTGRPIISGNGSPTKHVSLFVDSFLKPLVPLVSSYIHDTPDLLRSILDTRSQAQPSSAHLMCLPCTPTFPTMKGLMLAPKLWLRVVILHPPSQTL